MMIAHDLQPQPLLESLTQHLDASQMLPELRQALLTIAQADGRHLDRGQLWAWLIPALQAMFGDTDEHAQPFAHAWGLMNAATGRLDDLQDHDPTDDPLPFSRPDVQYHLVLSYYVLATSLLDDLSPAAIPPQRIANLRRLWSNMVLRAASGQLRDLLAPEAVDQPDQLTYYQHLAQAKSGSIFALAFGGTATLLSDDAALIQAFTVVGELFGTLVQYGDDVEDMAAQPNATLTLPMIYATTAGERAAGGPSPTPHHYWSYLYQRYYAYVEQILQSLPNELREPLRQIFRRAFATG
jgi:geranylgeranyl pyrophosphate synthase